MKPLVSLQLETTGLGAVWGHCDQIQNYLAQLASHDRTDTFLYANLLSTVLNELLEVVFSRHQPPGMVNCRLLRRDRTDRVELTLSVDAAGRDFYERSVAAAQASGVSELYTRS